MHTERFQVAGDQPVLPEGMVVEVSFVVSDDGSVYALHLWGKEFQEVAIDYEVREIEKLVARLLRVVSSVHARMKQRGFS